MNKKRRWEVDFLKDLAGIQKSENFEILFLERTRKGAYDWPRPYTSGWIRVRRQKNLKKELKRFEIFEENSEENSEFLENLEPQKPKNQKFYNLEEHFVENRRKRRVKK
ncbi:hypothetical protein L5515_009730 [Caenorhabditis briggsae]|uniref:Uncharacterized protein n=1 Tax=Caenorhabditis briggsae TaxID=6238 RepID=A0AAE9JMN1_CAEBR|nr:hypothetical protein L5515_009730 [Caenorhabditis briggsae]